ncbi:DUF6141 family protein [Methanolobus sp. ZRKC2]|uniref:DUF6141 family protein n=1 Tax=Methanolobus sp. ZRKC2 TaxID=3125783 RepID=UPI00324E2492
MVDEDIIFFREQQKFDQLWLWLLVLLPVAIVWYGAIQQLVFGEAFGNNPTSDNGVLFLLVIFGVLLPVFMLSIRLITEVRSSGLYIRFYPFHLSFKKYQFESIKSYEVCQYNPLRDYGGWGIRFGPKGRAYNVSGNKGVLLEFRNGKKLMVGSQNPDELAAAISRGMGSFR